MSPGMRLTNQAPILIIGAGLGGLTLAHGLRNLGVPFRIFESDPTREFRAQGYRLKIDSDGAYALKSVLSPQMWEYFENTCTVAEAGHTNFNATDGSIIKSQSGGGPRGGMKTWTVDRTVLRGILLDEVKEDIAYGKRFANYTLTENGVTAQFEDGSSAQGTLLVGADGVRSAVRKQFLPGHKPLDTAGSCIYGKTPLTSGLMERFPATATKWMALVQDKRPITQTLDNDETPLSLLLEPIWFQKNEYQSQMPEDYIYWVLIARTTVFGRPRDELLKPSHEECAGLSLSLTQKWHDCFRVLFELQDVSQSSSLRLATVNPNLPVWDASDRITLIGDAVHVMSPCGGLGAVTALRDGALLAKVIGESGISAQSIGRYEDEMRGYAKTSVQGSFFGGKKIFGQRPFEECEIMDI